MKYDAADGRYDQSNGEAKRQNVIQRTL